MTFGLRLHPCGQIPDRHTKDARPVALRNNSSNPTPRPLRPRSPRRNVPPDRKTGAPQFRAMLVPNHDVARRKTGRTETFDHSRNQRGSRAAVPSGSAIHFQTDHILRLQQLPPAISHVRNRQQFRDALVDHLSHDIQSGLERIGSVRVLDDDDAIGRSRRKLHVGSAAGSRNRHERSSRERDSAAPQKRKQRKNFGVS